ncbi:MAG: sigma-70 family RNA polymerase sigma factor [Planctomycetes bacterium]|nr:sigma-70 family RNA polymerase sigma factor [Planctomycetota bacterium]
MDLEEIYNRLGPELYRHALILTRSGPDAEDAVQNVFWKVASLLRRGRAIAQIEPYLRTAVRREALRARCRRWAVRPELEIVAAQDGADAEEASRVNTALGRLPPAQCEIVFLHVYEGLTFRRIGEILGISPDTAASRYRYAREKLKEWLSGDRGPSA